MRLRLALKIINNDQFTPAGRWWRKSTWVRAWRRLQRAGIGRSLWLTYFF